MQGKTKLSPGPTVCVKYNPRHLLHFFRWMDVHSLALAFEVITVLGVNRWRKTVQYFGSSVSLYWFGELWHFLSGLANTKHC